MKEMIVDIAGKTWQFLALNGETDISVLSKKLNEKNDVVLQSLGWLAREDKINYADRNNITFVSLIDSEMQIFQNAAQNMKKAEEASKTSEKQTKST